MNHDSKAWRLYALSSFAASFGLMILGVLAIPGDVWMKGFFLVTTFFLVGSCFTLAKTLRDVHESSNLVNRIENAKTERILKEFAR